MLGPMATYDFKDEAKGEINPSMFFRKKLDLFANIRPSRTYAGVKSITSNFDLIVVRENTEGFYADRNMAGGNGEILVTEDVGISMRRITYKCCERIARSAFELAMQRGKHVYVEKPMTRYLSEAFEIYDACKRTGKLLQVGSQGCSDRKWHKAAEWIRAGKIGPIVMSQGSYMRNNPHGEWNYTIAPWAKPDDINWKMWLGEQIKTAHSFDPDHYFRWRKYYPYCSGLLGDLFPHKLHPYMLATGNPEFPVRVAAVGSKAFKTDLNQVGRKPEQATQYVRDVEEIIQLVAEFPSGYVMHITSSTVNEVGSSEMIRGHKATLTMGGNKVQLNPERPFAEDIEPETSEAFPGESVAAHHKNFYESIRANKQPNAGIDLATKVQTVISLAEMSDRLGVMCYFDAKTRKVTDKSGKEISQLTYGWDKNS